MNTPIHSLTALLATSIAIFTATAVQSATLANDNFTLSNGTGVGTVSDASSSGVGTYSTIQGTNGMSVTTQSGFGSGNVLSLAINSNTYYRAFDTAGFTLNSLSVGETLSLSYSIRFSGTPDGTAKNFSFGFVNNSSPNSIIYANVDLATTGAADSEFRYRSGSFNMSDTGLIAGTSFAATALAASTNYTFGLNVTKTATGFDISYLRDGSTIGTSSLLSSSTWATAMGGVTMTGIALRYSSTPNVTTYIDNVSVTTFSAVPEPSTFALIGGLGALGFAASRRRR